MTPQYKTITNPESGEEDYLIIHPDTNTLTQCRRLKDREVIHTGDVYNSTTGVWQRADYLAGLELGCGASAIWLRRVEDV